MKEYKFEDLYIGLKASFKMKITEEMMISWSISSRKKMSSPRNRNIL